MNYSETLNYIHSAQKFGPRPGLFRIRALLRTMGDPQKQYRCVHITGTNGKGSTAMMTTRVLMAAGYKVGTFISPYVDDFRERMQINGEMIPHEDLCRQMDRLLPCIAAIRSMGHLHPTEFEMVTALALGYFSEQKCDIAVLEVGMGGRWDCTNVIDAPEVAAITPVALDHMKILGNTVEEIATDKCGIFKEGSIAVTCFDQNPEALSVIHRYTEKLGIPLRIPDKAQLKIIYHGLDGNDIEYHGIPFHISMPGEHQIQNALTVIEICHALRERGWTITDEMIQKGIASTRFGGRLEIIRQNPLCILDGGHNPNAADALVRMIKTELSGRRLITVMGMMEDKDTAFCASQLAKCSSVFIATQCSQPRAIAAEELAKIALPYTARVLWDSNLQNALYSALEIANPDDVILVCGSLYTLHDARLILTQ